MKAKLPQSGVLVIDKPQGVTSHDVVAAVRSALHMKRVGHAGTLDPMATGVLVVGFGAATRLLNYIVGANKTYETTIRLGATTTTDDAEGDFISTDESALAIGLHTGDFSLANINEITDEQICAAAQEFIGVIDQIPSTFSAIKVDGKRAYDLAREGKEVELKSRKITVHDFTITSIEHIPSESVIDIQASIACSSGTYIRALGRDLGIKLGVGGYLTSLRRTRVGNFDVEDRRVVSAHVEERTYTQRDGKEVTRSKTVLDINNAVHSNVLQEPIYTTAQVARLTMPVVEITAKQAVELRFGRPISMHVHKSTAAILTHRARIGSISSLSSTSASDGDKGSSNPVSEELIAILDPWRKGTAKPSVVFPDEYKRNLEEK